MADQIYLIRTTIKVSEQEQKLVVCLLLDLLYLSSACLTWRLRENMKWIHTVNSFSKTRGSNHKLNAHKYNYWELRMSPCCYSNEDKELISLYLWRVTTHPALLAGTANLQTHQSSWSWYTVVSTHNALTMPFSSFPVLQRKPSFFKVQIKSKLFFLEKLSPS